MTDAHVHFWDPSALHYPWLEELPALRRAFGPDEYATAAGDAPVERLVFVECNCVAEESAREVAFVERLAEREPRIAGIVAFADVAAHGAAALDALPDSPLVKGVRQNIQGQPSGFCIRRTFVDGVREAARRGLAFDLCATHDQLGDVIALVERCPDARFVLDHCGKPAIRARAIDTWGRDLATLAAHDGVWCKLSGLLTEAGAEWTQDDLLPYAERVAEHFGPARMLYGSDWPVLTLAGTYAQWYDFTRRVAKDWSGPERDAFYSGNAARAYEL
ncbi:amidohydrolase 2 (plasmid) [Gemmatirosa kalamazoonensis]|uniref:Amidohydrolase 2 n=1 Tax=Gemmatirosa kalamazoonensis TaxID=861299 RepID=W0RR00_9BACT|nr:amidohydrolase family protein [Gemmatirosa kalamazoonensis]AHG93136.1 amidohydrolase 2 [Gemmatirosa kalamazoonensis]